MAGTFPPPATVQERKVDPQVDLRKITPVRRAPATPPRSRRPPPRWRMGSARLGAPYRGRRAAPAGEAARWCRSRHHLKIWLSPLAPAPEPAGVVLRAYGEAAAAGCGACDQTSCRITEASSNPQPLAFQGSQYRARTNSVSGTCQIPSAARFTSPLPVIEIAIGALPASRSISKTGRPTPVASITKTHVRHDISELREPADDLRIGGTQWQTLEMAHVQSGRSRLKRGDRGRVIGLAYVGANGRQVEWAVCVRETANRQALRQTIHFAVCV
jgi:hypothetical protein